jgi:1-deoxy-D-xylulose-5-phosphate reductoisomerase
LLFSGLNIAGPVHPQRTGIGIIVPMAKGVAILGSTGSIGRSALDVIDGLAGAYRVVALVAGSGWESLAQQAERYRPAVVGLADTEHLDDLRAALGSSTEILAGPRALEGIAAHPDADVVINAVVGAAGLPATVAAAEAGKVIALANKESMVAAGAIIMPIVRRSGSSLLPIDSEHSAIFQALRSGHRAEVRRIYLTASGGPFRSWAMEQMAAATLDDALNHPTWDMGRKITVDSATMMNKALEIIEAHWLFDISPDDIEVVVHPESIVHGMVEFCDGSLIAQLGAPDMRTPIQYALTYPDRRPCRSRCLDLAGMGRLTLEPPDRQRFPALDLGYEAARRGGTAGAVLNAANEAAVEEFCEGRLAFTDITRISADILNKHETIEVPTLQDVMAADRWARNEVLACLGTIQS